MSRLVDGLSPAGERYERRHRASQHFRSDSLRAHQRSSKRKRSRSPTQSVTLPFHNSNLTKHDLTTYKPMFALYLDVQKQLILEDLPEDEVKGRWKSFIGKWNRGELDEGWYDPATLHKAAASTRSPARGDALAPEPNQPLDTEVAAKLSSDEDVLGPSLPNDISADIRTSTRSGPAIPNLQDLELQKGMFDGCRIAVYLLLNPPIRESSPSTQSISNASAFAELAAEQSIEQRSALRQYRALDRKQDKERLEELLPRAEPGSRERQLEKKRETAATNRAFAAQKTESGGVEEVPEEDLLGGEDSRDSLKKQKKEMERKKNDREIRREEILRARAVERDERIREYKAKEEKTMSGLIALAKQRFG
ncbi:MAG: hypothetical protein LQ347_004026 [Umbilicaria vellea]|nr:MAG: hypothetical protein LQ347_004026 [Umbilicaria vellea]